MSRIPAAQCLQYCKVYQQFLMKFVNIFRRRLSNGLFSTNSKPYFLFISRLLRLRPFMTGCVFRGFFSHYEFLQLHSSIWVQYALPLPNPSYYLFVPPTLSFALLHLVRSFISFSTSLYQLSFDSLSLFVFSVL